MGRANTVAQAVRLLRTRGGAAATSLSRDRFPSGFLELGAPSISVQFRNSRAAGTRTTYARPIPTSRSFTVRKMWRVAVMYGSDLRTTSSQSFACCR